MLRRGFIGVAIGSAAMGIAGLTSAASAQDWNLHVPPPAPRYEPVPPPRQGYT